MKAAVASLATALVLIGGAWAHGVSLSETASLSPPCPQAHYGADGTMGPVFCVVDNPLALHYYGPTAKHLFTLGPNASPGQVEQAAVADYRHSTEPILCESYRLAAWRENWQFGISAAADIGNVLHFPNGWCTEPRFQRRIDY
jgi:hypothetical protein